MALAGGCRLIHGLLFLWTTVSFISVTDGWTHWHYPSYTESFNEAEDMKRDVIQPVYRRSAHLGGENDDHHHRYRRDTLPISYRSLAISDQPGNPIAPHCSAWSQSHFKTFDGKIYNFHGACRYTLAMDCTSFTFRVSIQNDFECFNPGSGNVCNRTVVILNGDATTPVYLRPGLVVGHGSSSLDLPTTLDGLVIERVGDSIMVTSGLGYKVVFDGDEALTVYITSDDLRQHTCGLCGVYNDNPDDEFKGPGGRTYDNAYDFGLSWKEDEDCDDVPAPTTLCTQIFIPPHLVHFYKDFIDHGHFVKATCKALEDDARFTSCHSVIDVTPYITACQRDMCNCMNGQEECSCNSMTAYAQECSHNGVTLDWRSNELCPWTCSADTVYHSCGTTCTQMCGSAVGDCEEERSVGCIEGCQCPSDRYLNSDGHCVKEDDCPCVSNGVEYETGSTISDGCNQCTCDGGKWTCTDKVCETVCWATGDPHYKTFDDKRYDFMGECAYHLIKDCWNDVDTFEVIAENAPCHHHGATCTNKITVRNNEEYVTLFKNHRVAANGEDVDTLPYVGNGIMVDKPTSLITVVSLGNGLVVRWDGNSRVEVVAPPTKFNRTCGLCGTFNKHQADDFMTPEGERVSSPIVFGNSWKASFPGDTCPDLPPIEEPQDVCAMFSQRQIIANEQCSKLYNEPVFQACHRVLDPAPYVEDCRYDVCKGNGHDDNCPMFSQYASDCRQKGVVLKDWRKSISECDITCDFDGMSYSECAPSCGASCQSIHAIANGATCRDVCVEGCHCDNGKVLGPGGNCIPESQCPCENNHEWFANGELIDEGCGTCSCTSGTWQCDDVTCPPITCPPHQFYSECSLPLACQPTCKNFHNPPPFNGECQPACECDTNAGYVLHDGVCTAIAECPCYYKGEVYAPHEEVKCGCEVCTCENGDMKCDNQYCEGSCIAWGDPHYQTFDGKKYDFQGECDYVLATNSHYPEARQFHILVANVPCGSGGVTCTKAITMSIGTGPEQEKVRLVRGSPIQVDTGIGGLTEFTITESGLYILVHTRIGVTLIWDRATRIEVKVTGQHFNSVGGLCGNYNDMQEDDFLPPGGGIPLVDPNDFGNSWKVHDYCGKPSPITDPCVENPHRKTWAQKRCSIINSDLFARCHQYVPPTSYFNKCVFDSCGCDSGGDCECMCTAIATYAQKCNEFGVPIKWRSQELCPIQCEGCLTYEPCIPVCESSCENTPFALPNGLCVDTCVEGCACPPGTILENDECVEECKEVPTTLLPSTVQPTSQEPTMTTHVKHNPTTLPPSTRASTTTHPPQPTTPAEICDCWGYGDPHYFDFNGVEFDHQGLCTYVLAQDKSNPPQFTVLLHNVECDSFPGTTCPREVEVIYDGHQIRMLAEKNDLGEYEVIINGDRYTPPVLTFDSFTVEIAGLYMLFDAPSIGLQVRYLPVDLHYFKVEVPKVIYYNNTEGLCGNCGNPEPTCEENGTCCDWLAPPSIPSQCGCDEAEPTECIPGPDVVEWCDKLYEDLFSDCHHVVDPEMFHKNCLYNGCFANQVDCWDFEAYVTECAANGVCMDWREDDFCPFDCKSDELHYRECTCPDDIYTSCFPWDKEPHLCDQDPVSGCFCNEGSMDDGSGNCIPCPTVIPTTPVRTTTVPTTQPEPTTKATTPKESTTQPPPESTTVTTTPPPTTQEAKYTTSPPESTTVESTVPESTTVESTQPESTTVEPTSPESTTVKSTQPPTTMLTTTLPPTTTPTPPKESTTVESTPPESTTVESTPPESTTVKSTIPTTTTLPPTEPTTVKSTPPRSTTVESTPPESTTVESTPPESTTVESTQPESTTVESTQPPATTVVESTTRKTSTTRPVPESTTVESTPPESTTVESTQPESTTVKSTLPPTTKPEPTTVKSTPPQPTTVDSTPPESTTVESTPPESTTVESTQPESTTVESTSPSTTKLTTTLPPTEPTTIKSTPPRSTTVESTPPESTTVESTPPESTTVESTQPESTTVESTPPSTTKLTTTLPPTEPTTTKSTSPRSTTVESTPPESTTVESTPPESTTVESTPPESTTAESTQEVTTIESTQASTTGVTTVEYTTAESTPDEATTVESTTESPTTAEVIESTTELLPGTTECVPGVHKTCQWSQYLDDDVSGVTLNPSYEFELIQDFVNSGLYDDVCQIPEAIECVLARDHSISYNMTTQDVLCSTHLGLTCYNSEAQACLDYAIRIQCCQQKRVVCGSTESPSTTIASTVPEESTTELSTLPAESTTVESTTLEQETTTVPPTTTVPSTTEVQQTTVCVPHHEYRCEWTPFYDDSDSVHGEFELIGDLQDAHPGEICESPENIECVLSSNHSISAGEVGQDLICLPNIGLVCQDFNNGQTQPFECYDYSVRFECCESVFIPCGSTEAPLPTTKRMTTPPESTTAESTTLQSTTTECIETVETICDWSPWLDDDIKVGPMGEFELISTYREDYDICDMPSKIECVLKSRPGVHSNETGQEVTCDVTEGLVCLHSEQTDFPPFCFDYMIRVQCCHDVTVPCSPVTTIAAESTTKPTTKPQPTTAVPTIKPVLTTEPVYTTKPVSPTTVQPTTEPVSSTTRRIAESTTRTVTEIQESTTLSESTLPQESTTAEEPTTSQAESTTKKPTTRPLPSTQAPTTPCKPTYTEVCEWSPWLDDDEFKVGPIGEFELISTFRDNYDICEEPTEILCALKSDHNLHANMTHQKLVCTPDEGLICLHADQTGLPPFCFDYSIRVKCCKSVSNGCVTTPEPVVTTVESTSPEVVITTAPSHIIEKCSPIMSEDAITISKDGCSTPTPVFLPQCQGRCESHASFGGFDSDGNEFWNSSCGCCRPKAFEMDHYELMCEDGETVTLPVDIVTECSCKQLDCPSR